MFRSYLGLRPVGKCQSDYATWVDENEGKGAYQLSLEFPELGILFL